MADSRTKNTKRNIIFSFLEIILTMGFQFISRSIIVYVFSSQYLGLSSLFSSILQVLNMADLGFSVSIVYNMYKPISEHNVDAVCALLNYYKRIYRIVGLVILGIGIMILPVIPYLINGEWPTGINIYVVYSLYLVNTVLSYFLFAYKSALLNALQRLDLTKIAYSIANIIQYAIQIFCILVLKNFYLFIFCMLVGTVFRNVFCAYISKKKFPEYECRGNLSYDVRKSILIRVKGLLISNISSVTYTTFDSIILSAFLGLSTVAIYNNYVVIFNGVMNFVVLIRNAMQASVGNSIVVESKGKNYQDMIVWQYLFSLIAAWCATCMISLYQPFMSIWMGDNMLLPMRDVILICIWFFFGAVPHAFYLYMSGNGMWWEMRWPYILSTVCNLGMNIVLGKLIGVTGIIFSTVFSSIIFGLIWQCLIVFRNYYTEMSAGIYLTKQLLLFAAGILTSGLAYFINCNLHVNGIVGILIRAVVCTLVFVFVFYSLYRKTNVYKKTKAFVLTALRI